MTVVIFAGGADPSPGILDHLPPDAFVVAADSGLDHAARIGVAVDLVIGDMDSVSAAALARQPAGTIQRHPVNKDATDLELAVDLAIARNTRELIVVGGHGGRNDHLLANALLLASPRLGGARTRWYAGEDLVQVVRDRAQIQGRTDAVVSLIPFPGASGVTTEGLRWPLNGEDLTEGTTRGVSNELLGATATITIGGGLLLVVQPGYLGTGD